MRTKRTLLLIIAGMLITLIGTQVVPARRGDEFKPGYKKSDPEFRNRTEKWLAEARKSAKSGAWDDVQCDPSPPPTLADAVEWVKDFTKAVPDHGVAGPTKDAARNLDNVMKAMAKNGSLSSQITGGLAKGGTFAEVVDLLGKMARVHDEYKKNTPEGYRKSKSMLVSELGKFFAGNFAGGQASSAAATALMAAGYGTFATFFGALAAGYVATKAVETAIQAGADFIEDRNTKLSEEEMMKRAYESLDKAADNLDIPEGAWVTWKEDSQGHRLQEVTWTGDDGKEYVYGAYFDPLGHQIGSEFDEKSAYTRRTAAVNEGFEPANIGPGATDEDEEEETDTADTSTDTEVDSSEEQGSGVADFVTAIFGIIEVVEEVDDMLDGDDEDEDEEEDDTPVVTTGSDDDDDDDKKSSKKKSSKKRRKKKKKSKKKKSSKGSCPYGD